MNYYISDMHFGHSNILRHSKRPFDTVDEMDNNIIRNWNSIVTNNDDVYILGDFCFKSKSPKNYLEQLNGKLHLIVGNHDGTILKDKVLRSYFKEIRDILTVNDNNKKIVLCHYPMVEWNGYFRDALHFYGHIHNNVANLAYKIMKDIPNAYNVGVDILDFKPCTMSQVIEMNNKFNSK